MAENLRSRSLNSQSLRWRRRRLKGQKVDSSSWPGLFPAIHFQHSIKNAGQIMTVRIYTFDEALKRADERKHLLLGNGFSIACKRDIFSYASLFENADFKDRPHIPEIFERLGTRDFEEVMNLLRSLKKVIEVYVDNPVITEAVTDDYEFLKESLVRIVAGRHPTHPFEISDDAYRSCRKFLTNFKCIYSLNYDLLLYWALMKDDIDKLGLTSDDGFRSPSGDEDASYVAWESYHSASVMFMHGALHLFDAGHELRKYTWSRTKIALIDQIREALDKDLLPLFVSEGDITTKFRRITHNAYLHRCYQSFKGIGGSLFIYGHSLAENDNHILKCIERRDSRIKSLHVSIYGDPKSALNQKIINRAEILASVRADRRNPIAVEFFDAASAKIWG